eukprot:769611-Rhodomonas_salina.1
MQQNPRQVAECRPEASGEAGQRVPSLPLLRLWFKTLEISAASPRAGLLLPRRRQHHAFK